MNEDLKDLPGVYSPAPMPPELRLRLLAAMVQEDAEMRADAALERELTGGYPAAPMPDSLKYRLTGRLAPAAEYRLRWWRHAVAVLVALLVLPLLWCGLRPAPAMAAAPVVELKREWLPAAGEAPPTRCDTFVMQGADQSRLVIKVKSPQDFPLPDEVI